mmetsp:Transcript_20036/g.66274  ORF Transcript_20036/g.66274 Transcript_20036/m.66274 type:complete len:300 (+) Transcript_20036:946-1845(+)
MKLRARCEARLAHCACGGCGSRRRLRPPTRPASPRWSSRSGGVRRLRCAQRARRSRCCSQSGCAGSTFLVHASCGRPYSAPRPRRSGCMRHSWPMNRQRDPSTASRFCRAPPQIGRGSRAAFPLAAASRPSSSLCLSERCLSMATIRWICGCTTPGATSARVPLPKPARSTTGPSEYSRNSSTPTSSRGIRRRCAATRSDARSESLVVVERAHRRRSRGIRVAQASRRRSRSRDGQPPACLMLRSFGHAWTRRFAPMPRRHEPLRGSRGARACGAVYRNSTYRCARLTHTHVQCGVRTS